MIFRKERKSVTKNSKNPAILSLISTKLIGKICPQIFQSCTPIYKVNVILLIYDFHMIVYCSGFFPSLLSLLQHVIHIYWLMSNFVSSFCFERWKHSIWQITYLYVCYRLLLTEKKRTSIEKDIYILQSVCFKRWFSGRKFRSMY